MYSTQTIVSAALLVGRYPLLCCRCIDLEASRDYAMRENLVVEHDTLQEHVELVLGQHLVEWIYLLLLYGSLRLLPGADTHLPSHLDDRKSHAHRNIQMEVNPSWTGQGYPYGLLRAAQ